jgi:hypothetical protein
MPAFAAAQEERVLQLAARPKSARSKLREPLLPAV